MIAQRVCAAVQNQESAADHCTPSARRSRAARAARVRAPRYMSGPHLGRRQGSTRRSARRRSFRLAACERARRPDVQQRAGGEPELALMIIAITGMAVDSDGLSDMPIPVNVYARVGHENAVCSCSIVVCVWLRECNFNCRYARLMIAIAMKPRVHTMISYSLHTRVTEGHETPVCAVCINLMLYRYRVFQTRSHRPHV